MKCECGYASKDRWLQNPLRCPQCGARMQRMSWLRQRAFAVARNRLAKDQRDEKAGLFDEPHMQAHPCSFCVTDSVYWFFDDGQRTPFVWRCPLGCGEQSQPCARCQPKSISFSPLRLVRHPSTKELLAWDTIHLDRFCSVVATDIDERDRVFGWRPGEAVYYGARAAAALADRPTEELLLLEPWSEVVRIVKRIAQCHVNRSAMRKRMPDLRERRELQRLRSTLWRDPAAEISDSHLSIRALLAAVGGALLLGSSKSSKAIDYGLSAASWAHRAGLSRVTLAEIAVRTLAEAKGRRSDDRLVDAGAAAWLAGRPDVARRFIK